MRQETLYIPEEFVHVLLIELHKLARQTESVLNRLNCTVDIATNKKVVRKHIKKHIYDIIFVNIDVQSGIRAIHKIRTWKLSRNQEIPIVGLTAEFSGRKQLPEVATILEKPLSLISVSDTLKNMC
jgi:DNA-binding response OmpR family regulator